MVYIRYGYEIVLVSLLSNTVLLQVLWYWVSRDDVIGLDYHCWPVTEDGIMKEHSIDGITFRTFRRRGPENECVILVTKKLNFTIKHRENNSLDNLVYTRAFSSSVIQFVLK